MLSALLKVGIGGTAVLIFAGIIEVTDLVDTMDQERARTTIEQSEDVNSLGIIYDFEGDDKSIKNLLRHNVNPSRFLVQKKGTTNRDGVILNRYNDAINAYLDDTPMGTPNCTDLVATGKINTIDCDYIAAKESSLEFMSFNDSREVEYETDSTTASLIGSISKQQVSVADGKAKIVKSKTKYVKVDRERVDSIIKKREVRIKKYMDKGDYHKAMLASKKIQKSNPRLSTNYMQKIVEKTDASSLSDSRKAQIAKEFIKSAAQLTNTAEIEKIKSSSALAIAKQHIVLNTEYSAERTDGEFTDRLSEELKHEQFSRLATDTETSSKTAIIKNKLDYLMDN